MNRTPLIALSVFCILILAGGLILYFVHFPGSWSTEQAVWGTFGDFFNVFVNVANLVLVAFIAVITANASNRISTVQLELSRSQLRIEELKVTPHLYITEKKSRSTNQDSWFIQHTGDGPAINILVRFKLVRNNAFTRWISCLSLGSGDERELVWLRNADTIEISYCDITEQNCLLYTFQDRIGRTSTISKAEYITFRDSSIANKTNTHPDLVNRYLAGGNLNYQPFFNLLL